MISLIKWLKNNSSARYYFSALQHGALVVSSGQEIDQAMQGYQSNNFFSWSRME